MTGCCTTQSTAGELCSFYSPWVTSVTRTHHCAPALFPPVLAGLAVHSNHLLPLTCPESIIPWRLNLGWTQVVVSPRGTSPGPLQRGRCLTIPGCRGDTGDVRAACPWGRPSSSPRSAAGGSVLRGWAAASRHLARRREPRAGRALSHGRGGKRLQKAAAPRCLAVTSLSPPSSHRQVRRQPAAAWCLRPGCPRTDLQPGLRARGASSAGYPGQPSGASAQLPARRRWAPRTPSWRPPHRRSSGIHPRAPRPPAPPQGPARSLPPPAGGTAGPAR